MTVPVRGGRTAGVVASMLVAACGSKSPSRARLDGGDAGATAAAAGDPGGPGVAGGAATTDASAADVGGGGTVAVTVLWPDAPVAARQSPGVSGCATSRRPRATVGALHGVADVVVIVEAAAGGKRAWSPPPVRLTLRDCAIEPPVAVLAGANGALEVQSQAADAQAIAVHDLGVAWVADARPPAGATLTRARLPVWGHTVALPLAAAGVQRVELAGSDDAAYVVAVGHPHAAVTAVDGTAALEGIPPGTYTVVAWLPPAAGQPAVTARGQVTVVGGDRVDLTLRLGS